ncbi:hypothetical protein SERLA73DRAFT_190456 [Serpula lacrymans var. lacrymans S7.3]|uniref:Uncharacterized protein n=2 Tax=Serpula lacrymans var. lacrymans TaxID=341189 RepID=F8QFN4_SERL3|nr:uncharacterized protein SERLADRAFT_457831 [Serpula lacrymans var. lacrymans S7.9]EGN92868.1 hypothetical protein SERLA73DRAFT_190456 [Serpula lacrymans var. lacrymans S7.3]EGO29701.1 hypothetical protein SERLADRAFT_457831 [Serpula lacrymans var. lacrymans S7.9]
MPWYFFPSRRELTIILFSITTFIFFYNFQSTSELSDTHQSTSSQSSFFGGFRFGKDKQPGEVGGDTDPSSKDLEAEIFGDWSWEDDKLSGSEEKQRAKGGPGKHKAINQTELLAQKQKIFGNVGLSDGYQYWGDDVPRTEVVKHIPGFTILNNVIVVNGTVFFVTDHSSSFPALESIVSPTEPTKLLDWQVLTIEQARAKLGVFGGVIRGVSWLSTDSAPSNYTLLSLWRTYSSLDLSIGSSGKTSLPSPRRLMFPNIPTYQGERPDLNGPIIVRARSSVGVHPFLLKTAFPTLGMMYLEDWQDFALMEAPFMMERVIVADKGAAELANKDVPAFALPLTQLESSQFWWEPVRQELAGFFGANEAPSGQGKTVVTYISRQNNKSGPKLKDADHQSLDQALRQMGHNKGYEINIISSEAPWSERMAAIVRSTVIVGVYGDSLAESIFMLPSSYSVVMEIFPSGVFFRDEELAVHSLGIRYVAWQNERKFSSNSLPPVTVPDDMHTRDISINPAAIIEAIGHEISK